MNLYSEEQSVLVLDNARIHHDNDLIEYIEAFGGRVEFLPHYSPDFNPIEILYIRVMMLNIPIAYSQITPQMAIEFFKSLM